MTPMKRAARLVSGVSKYSLTLYVRVGNVAPITIRVDDRVVFRVNRAPAAANRKTARQAQGAYAQSDVIDAEESVRMAHRGRSSQRRWFGPARAGIGGADGET